MKRTFAMAILVLVCLAAGSALAQDPTPPPPCQDDEARQFDFWVGQWEVHANDRIVGHSLISNIQGGCTLLEEYDTRPRNYEGKSFNYYDPNDDLWHQVWVDNGGLRLHLTGGYTDLQMVMSADRQTDDGTVTDRITWTDNQDGTVRQQWDVSPDKGATWNNIFDGLYRPVADSPAQEK